MSKLPVAEFDAEAYASGKASSRAHRRGSPAAIVNAVMFILNEKNRAMTRGELAEELERGAHHYQMAGRMPAQNKSALSLEERRDIRKPRRARILVCWQADPEQQGRGYFPRV
jgi:hypothetical protein